MNPYAADPGDVVKHLVLAELLHVERRRITTYIDTHSGRPWNDLSNPGEPAALRITALMAGLEPIYGKAEVRGRL
jgi:23S rRNA A2030 N6-methylase RlmJ